MSRTPLAGYQRLHRRNVLKFSAFAAVMVLIFVGLTVVFSQARFTATEDYRAVFVDASGLGPGNSVRIAGVPVGTVQGVEVKADNLAYVEFDVESKFALLRSTRAVVRYQNLVGDRYLELTEGPGSVQRLSPGGTIAKEQTSPALDLDQLLGGFKPLLRGLNPDQTNQLTGALIQVFQGQGQTLVQLLSTTGEFGKSLANRDQVIGQVIANLNTVLKSIADRKDQFSTTVDQLQQLISGLSAERDPLAASVPKIAGATGDLAQLLAGARPNFQRDIDQLGVLSGNVMAGEGDLQWVLDNLPDAYRKLARVGSYGSFLQLYYCAVKIKFTDPGGVDSVLVPPGAQNTGRCARS